MTTTANIQHTRMSLDHKLVFVPRRHRGETVFHLHQGNSYYRIGYREYAFVSLLDGQTTFADALALTARQAGPSALGTDEATQLYLWLLENQLGTIDSDAVVPSAKLNLAKRSPPLWNPFWLRFRLGNPDRFLAMIVPYGGWLFSAWATWLAALLVLVALGGLIVQRERLVSSAETIFYASNYLWLGLTWLLLKVVHELAHGVACRRRGCTVPAWGLVLVLLAPMAYIDVTSSWQSRSKWHRIQIACAGIQVELIIAALASIGWMVTESRLVASLLLNVAFMASVSTLVFNANPLMRFDGYYVLSDLLEVPNLHDKARRAVGGQLWRLFFGHDQQRPSRQTWFITTYGWLAAAWRIFVCVSLVLVASALFHGAGKLLAVVGIAAWWAPVIRPLAQALRQEWRDFPARFLRASLVTTAVIAIGSTALYLPIPTGLSAPAIVGYRDDINVRSLSAGFVDQVHVENGQVVRKGQLLLVLSNAEVSIAFHDVEISMQQARQRNRIAIDENRVAESQVIQRNMAALEVRRLEAQRRHTGLRILAPADGRIVSRSLDHLTGQYVEAGTLLFSIATDNRKELTVSVSQEHFDELIPRLGSRVLIRDSALRYTEGTLHRLAPRASVQLPHPAMAATEGGTLTVVATEHPHDGSTELLEPRFQGTVELSPDHASTLYCGQRVQVLLGFRRKPLLHWVIDFARAWPSQAKS